MIIINRFKCKLKIGREKHTKHKFDKGLIYRIEKEFLPIKEKTTNNFTKVCTDKKIIPYTCNYMDDSNQQMLSKISQVEKCTYCNIPSIESFIIGKTNLRCLKLGESLSLVC